MYKLLFTDYFKRHLKRLTKKDPHLKEVLLDSLKNFQKRDGISIGRNVFKIRLAGLSKGKSGGYRLYVFILESNSVLTPLCIYAKSQKENLSSVELTKHLNQVRSELEKWL